MRKTKKRRRLAHGVWKLEPSNPRRVAYEHQTSDWARAHAGPRPPRSRRFAVAFEQPDGPRWFLLSQALNSGAKLAGCLTSAPLRRESNLRRQFS
jgi:hypothetical protein